MPCTESLRLELLHVLQRDDGQVHLPGSQPDQAVFGRGDVDETEAVKARDAFRVPVVPVGLELDVLSPDPLHEPPGPAAKGGLLEPLRPHRFVVVLGQERHVSPNGAQVGEELRVRPLQVEPGGVAVHDLHPVQDFLHIGADGADGDRPGVVRQAEGDVL